MDTKRELIVERLKEIEKESNRLEKHDKRVHRRKDFDPDSIWVKAKKETKPEVLKRSSGGMGWKITTLRKKG